MKKFRLFILIMVTVVFGLGLNWAISNGKNSERENRNKVDTRIDNAHYWVNMAEKGYIEFNPDIKAPLGVYTGSKINALGVVTDDSPDVPVTEINSTQSENSIFVDPNNPDVVLNSNNSTQNPVGSLYGANDFYSFDAAESWEGEVQGAGGSNSGDPTTAIGLNGRWYVNYIDNPGGMGIAYSDDQGASWTTKTVAPNPGSLADKNHMWIDNSTTSPYEGNLYVTWTNFGGGNDAEIAMAYSHDNGETWVINHNISGNVNAGSHNQGVNVGIGPNGEVYVIWAIYDGWPTDETAIGMATSLDGGVTWGEAERVITNIRGIRTTETSKNMRVNSFPVCAVDISNGSDRGAIYVTWSNVGTPGINTGSDIDVYVTKSNDQGDTWSNPLKVNQDESGQGKEHYFPWITCDPANGILSVVFYDDRNVNSNQAEVFCANSDDGGETWEDFKVSDVSFTPSPIPGLAAGYFGDYLGIISQDGWVYPVWADNRTGTAMSYCSPYQTNPLNRPRDLVGIVTFESGDCDLSWTYEIGENFLNFKIYRDGEFLTETTEYSFTDNLPDYGVYSYQVTAFYAEDMESGAAGTSVQWGDAHISVDPLVISEHLLVDSISTKQITVINTGQLELVYSLSSFTNEERDVLDYCAATGGGDEYISKVEVGEISNSSGSNNYSNYINQSAIMQIGESYLMTVTNGNPYDQDQCGVWIDWDQNGEFDESPIIISGSPGNGPYTATIVPPPGSVTGETIMRVRILYTGSVMPCGTTTYGEVEDYTINVQGWYALSPLAGTILPGDTSIIDVVFDSHNMDSGQYSATALFSSNDPNTSEVAVDISLLISSLLVDANSDKEGVCLGDEAIISTEVHGNTDTLTYSWTSNPEGFVSDSNAIVVMPEVSTWYFVSVSDTSGNTVNDSVYLMVYDLPIVDLGADKTHCGNAIITLDAGNEGSTYSWSTGEDTQTVVANGDGPTDFWVDVTNASGCTTRDEVEITFGSIPEVYLGVDTTLCGNSGITLDAGNEGSEYLWSNGEETQTILVDTSDYGYGIQAHSVLVTNEYGCESESEIEIEFLDCTGIDETEAKVDVSVYPNPSRGIVNVKLESLNTETVNIKITGVNGKIVFAENNIIVSGNTKKEINMGSFADGVYTLFVSGQNYVVNKKIILQH